MAHLRGPAPLLVGGFALAACAAAAVVVGALYSPLIGLAAGCAIAAMIPVAVYGVEWGVPVFALMLVALEEFPSGLAETGAEGVERSTRTAFYAKSMGLSGLYPSDVILLGLLGLLFMNAVLLRRRRFFAMDSVGLMVIALITMVILSAVISLAAGDPFSGSIPEDDTTVLYHFNDRALRLIGVFQIKNFVMLLPAYLCGLLYLDRPERLERLLMAILVGFVVLACEGVARVARHPGILGQGSPLFYDSPSSWFFALFAFYTVSAWGRGVITGYRAAAFGLFSAVLMLFVVISFRRTMWGGIAISGAAILAALPGRARLRLILGGAAIAAVAGTALILSPVGALIAEKVGQRIDQTGGTDLSTIYRLAMFVHFSHGDDTPVFGWGVTPLWNKLVQFGYLTFNLENMHSLYFWIWLRTGLAGFTVATIAFLFLLGRAGTVFIASHTPQIKALALCLLAMIFIYLFSGVFNPVYGEFRYIVPLGLALAILTRLPQFDRMSPGPPC